MHAVAAVRAMASWGSSARGGVIGTIKCKKVSGNAQFRRWGAIKCKKVKLVSSGVQRGVQWGDWDN